MVEPTRTEVNVYLVDPGGGVDSSHLVDLSLSCHEESFNTYGGRLVLWGYTAPCAHCVPEGPPPPYRSPSAGSASVADGPPSPGPDTAMLHVLAAEELLAPRSSRLSVSDISSERWSLSQ